MVSVFWNQFGIEHPRFGLPLGFVRMRFRKQPVQGLELQNHQGPHRKDWNPGWEDMLPQLKPVFLYK